MKRFKLLRDSFFSQRLRSIEGGNSKQLGIEACKSFNICYNSDMEYHNCNEAFMKRFGFTFAEVLITLGIIGVVAAITLPSLITKIQNRGYVEKFKKSYSALQQATLMIEQETGIRAQDFDIYGDNEIGNQKNIDMFNLYAKYLKIIAPITSKNTNINNHPYITKTEYKYINNEQAGWGALYICAYYFPALLDGTVITFTPISGSGGCYMWDVHNANAKAKFMIDVNGAQKPNKLGRDIFLIYLGDDGKLFAPQTYESTTPGKLFDCNPDKAGKEGYGFTCSGRIITEGKMNY